MHTTATTNGRFLDGLLFGGTKHFTKKKHNNNVTQTQTETEKESNFKYKTKRLPNTIITVSAVHTKVMSTDESCMLCVDSEELKNSFTLSSPATNSYFTFF